MRSTPPPPSLEADDTLAPLLAARPVRTATALPEAVVGELIGFVDDGLTPLVRYPGQPGTAALRALRARPPCCPRGPRGAAVLRRRRPATPDRDECAARRRHAAGRSHRAVQVDVDGERLVVRAANQLVLQCGEASITLTKAGKVLIQGTYVSSRSSGVNRVHGGSVELN